MTHHFQACVASTYGILVVRRCGEFYNEVTGIKIRVAYLPPQSYRTGSSHCHDIAYFSRAAIFTSRAAAESYSTVGSSFPGEEEEDHCLLNLGFYGICAIFNLKT